MEKQKETIHQDAGNVKEQELLDEQNCLDLRIPAHLVEEEDEEDKY